MFLGAAQLLKPGCNDGNPLDISL